MHQLPILLWKHLARKFATILSYLFRSSIRSSITCASGSVTAVFDQIGLDITSRNILCKHHLSGEIPILLLFDGSDAIRHAICWANIGQTVGKDLINGQANLPWSNLRSWNPAIFSHESLTNIIKYRNVCIDTLNAHRNYRSLNILSSQVTICRMGQKQWRCAQSCESLPKWTSSVFKGHPNFQQCVRFCAGPLIFLKEGNPRINNRLSLGLILGSIGMYMVYYTTLYIHMLI